MDDVTVGDEAVCSVLVHVLVFKSVKICVMHAVLEEIIGTVVEEAQQRCPNFVSK